MAYSIIVFQFLNNGPSDSHCCMPTELLAHKANSSLAATEQLSRSCRKSQNLEYFIMALQLTFKAAQYCTLGDHICSTAWYLKFFMNVFSV